MTAIFPIFPTHGDGDWDEPLLTGLAQIVTLLNQHDLLIQTGAIGSGSSGNTGTTTPATGATIGAAAVQNADGTWTLTVNGVTPVSTTPTTGSGSYYSGGIYYDNVGTDPGIDTTGYDGGTTF